MEYSAEVRRRFAAALAGTGPGGSRDAAQYAGEAEDRSLGVWARARIGVAAGRIVSAEFDVYGCPDTIAAAQLAAQQLSGVGLDDFHGLDAPALSRALGIPTEKLGKVLRLEDAVIAALERAREQGHEESDNGHFTD